MSKIRLAVIGTGGMANNHAEHYTKMENVSLVACCDIDKQRAKDYAKKYNIPKVYTDYVKLLDEIKPDAVTVVTPDRFHADPCIQALKRGIHTMSEKPLADCLESAKLMLDAALEAKKKGVMTAVNFSYRNDAATQKMAEIVNSWDLGKVIRVEGHYRQSWISSNIWGDSKQNPGMQWRMSKKHGSLGCMGDTGVHIYDLASFVCGDFDQMFCQLDCYEKDIMEVGEYVFDANETMHTIVKFKNGARGTIDASRWDTGFSNQVSLMVFCEFGSLDLNLDREKGGRLRMCAGDNRDRGAWEFVACPDTPNNYERFIASIIDHKQGQTSFEQAYKVQEYLNASLISDEKQSYVKF